jgi:predicted PurR-regulated permease PerM
MMMPERPFRWGFTVTLGVLLGLAVGGAAMGISGVLLLVFAALFISFGLDPLVQSLQRRGFSRTGAVATVAVAVALFVILVLWWVIPFAIRQATLLRAALPAYFDNLTHSSWSDSVDFGTNGLLKLLLQRAAEVSGDPQFWAFLSGGLVRFGIGLVDAVSAGVFIAVLTLYFLGSLSGLKNAVYSIVPASRRPTFISLSEQITDSVGRYLSGMFTLALINSIFSFVLLTVTGVPFAALIALLALFITLIPLVGTILTTALMTVVALFTSPTTALIVLITMLVYMQVEAYVLTPRVMSRAVRVPGAAVLIAAMAGGTLLGLAGALVAIPVAAGLLLIIQQVIVPARAEE